ncbi:16S rRNA (guanine(966)-N(2))-methyltransferase RsmD [Deltaproteobacteria bacterium Smac51]|nr:16S rRNA (guanine(966)-N(2))-methyltransferase RsmD [Deltaproteobacteria bacterium Smac51]
MPRIIAGRYRGLKLSSPKGRSTRPTADQVKEAVFSMLVSLPFEMEGARVLDFFAGSGALALEALSRGAGAAVMADSDRNALEVIRRNAALLKPQPDISIIRARWPQGFDRLIDAPPFNLFLLDPPYENQSLPLTLLREVSERSLAEPGAVAVWEQAPETLKTWTEELIAPWRVLKTRIWGGQAVAVLKIGGLP